MPPPLHKLPALLPDGTIRVVIETPKGSRNKYAWDEALGAFALHGVLPEGTSFPYDFGMIPSTVGRDGDPLDILLIMDVPAFPGCVISARLIGAIEAEQRDEDGWSGNDRLVGVATQARTHEHVQSFADLPPSLPDEIEAFFEHYNRLADRRFAPRRRLGPEDARALLDAAMAEADKAE